MRTIYQIVAITICGMCALSMLACTGERSTAGPPIASVRARLGVDEIRTNVSGFRSALAYKNWDGARESLSVRCSTMPDDELMAISDPAEAGFEYEYFDRATAGPEAELVSYRMRGAAAEHTAERWIRRPPQEGWFYDACNSRSDTTTTPPPAPS